MDTENTSKDIVKSVNRLFAVDAVIMGSLLALLSWGALEIVGSKEAIAAIQEKTVALDKNSELISKTSVTLLRMEISQEYHNKAINKDIKSIKDSLGVLTYQVNKNSTIGEQP